MKLVTEGMGRSRLKVLLSVLHLYGMRGRVTVQEAADGAGLSLATTHAHLRALRADGWVDWQDGCDGTLRPLVEVVPEWDAA